MDMKPILVKLHEEKERISRAIVALEGLNGAAPVNSGPKSPEVRRKMSEGQKRRWREIRAHQRQGKKAA